MRGEEKHGTDRLSARYSGFGLPHMPGPQGRMVVLCIPFPIGQTGFVLSFLDRATQMCHVYLVVIAHCSKRMIFQAKGQMLAARVSCASPR